MEKVFGFDYLKPGQHVKVKGKPAEGGRFAALEVSLKPPDNEAVLEGKIQAVDAQASTLRMMNRDYVLPNGIEIKSAQRESITLKNLKAGEIAKLKGTFSSAKGFVPAKVKMQESKGFSIDELQGDIVNVDPSSKTLELLGFSVAVSEKTEIEGFERPDRSSRGNRPDRGDRQRRRDNADE